MIQNVFESFCSSWIGLITISEEYTIQAKLEVFNEQISWKDTFVAFEPSYKARPLTKTWLQNLTLRRLVTSLLDPKKI